VQSDQEGCEAALVRARPAVVLRTWHNRQLGIGNCSKSLFLAFLREIWGGMVWPKGNVASLATKVRRKIFYWRSKCAGRPT
jgi:hypothetical protein